MVVPCRTMKQRQRTGVPGLGGTGFQLEIDWLVMASMGRGDFSNDLKEMRD